MLTNKYIKQLIFTKNMNIHQLRFIRATVRHDFNLSEAAKALYTSQPGLSKAILTFEEELGVQIFIRQSKRLKGLTDIGVEIVNNIEYILSKIDHIKKITAEYSNKNEGVLRIATTHTQARYTLPQVISNFSKEHPKIKVSILQGNPQQIISYVRDGVADIAIATEIYETGQEWNVINVFEWEHVLIAKKGHRIFDYGIIDLNILAKFPIITYSKDFSGRKKIDNAFENQNINTDIILEAADSDVIKTYAEIGMGIGILAGVAFNVEKDSALHSVKLGYLFGKQLVKIAYKNIYHRDFIYDFIRLLKNYDKLVTVT